MFEVIQAVMINCVDQFTWLDGYQLVWFITNTIKKLL